LDPEAKRGSDGNVEAGSQQESQLQAKWFEDVACINILM
jgi:hypothetical protein